MPFAAPLLAALGGGGAGAAGAGAGAAGAAGAGLAGGAAGAGAGAAGAGGALGAAAKVGAGAAGAAKAAGGGLRERILEGFDPQTGDFSAGRAILGGDFGKRVARDPDEAELVEGLDPNDAVRAIIVNRILGAFGGTGGGGDAA